jgi:hypothetical protein
MVGIRLRWLGGPRALWQGVSRVGSPPSVRRTEFAVPLLRSLVSMILLLLLGCIISIVIGLCFSRQVGHLAVRSFDWNMVSLSTA